MAAQTPTPTAPATMDPAAAIALIKSNLAEVLNPEIIDDVMLTQKRPLKVYWGTATTGRPHCEIGRARVGKSVLGV